MGQLHYGGEIICYQVRRLARVTRKLTIKVQPDGQVEVLAPQTASDEEINRGVANRARWIWEQLQPIRERLLQVRPRQYVSGETHFYLGKRYPLKVQEAPRAPQQVKLLRGMLCVTLRHNSPEKVRKLLFDWYKARARTVQSTPRAPDSKYTLGRHQTGVTFVDHADAVGKLLALRHADAQSAPGESACRMHRLRPAA